MKEFDSLVSDIRKTILEQIETRTKTEVNKLSKDELVDASNSKFGIKRIKKKGYTP